MADSYFDGTASTNPKKAGFNQSFGITEMLVNLTGSYISSISQNNLLSAFESCCRIVDVITPKLEDKELDDVDKDIKEITDAMPKALETYIHEGKTYLMNPELFNTTKFKLSKFYRKVNKLQDTHGYGMIDADDPKLAIYE